MKWRNKKKMQLNCSNLLNYSKSTKVPVQMSSANKIDLFRKLRPLQIVSPGKLHDIKIANDFLFPFTEPTGNYAIAVLSYNLLAQHHIWNDIYPYCKPGVLKWPWRRSNLLAELEAYGECHLMAFQECSKWKEFWEPVFRAPFAGKGNVSSNTFLCALTVLKNGIVSLLRRLMGGTAWL